MYNCTALESINCNNEGNVFAFYCLLLKGRRDKIDSLNGENCVLVPIKIVLLTSVQSEQFATWITIQHRHSTNAPAVCCCLKHTADLHHVIITLLQTLCPTEHISNAPKTRIFYKCNMLPCSTILHYSTHTDEHELPQHSH